MFFSVFFCTVRLSIFERFVFASFEPLRFCKKVRFVFPDLHEILNRQSIRFFSDRHGNVHIAFHHMVIHS